MRPRHHLISHRRSHSAPLDGPTDLPGTGPGFLRGVGSVSIPASEPPTLCIGQRRRAVAAELPRLGTGQHTGASALRTVGVNGFYYEVIMS